VERCGCALTGIGREIGLLCDPRATAVAADSRYSTTLATSRSIMMTYVVSEGRLFGLTPSEWTMMLVGVALCGFITLLF